MTKMEKLNKLRSWCDAQDYNIPCDDCICHKGDGCNWCDLDFGDGSECPEDVMDDALARIGVIEEPTTVNHPKHYNREGSMECVDEMLLIFGRDAVKHFCLCNAWKYRYRAADKNGEEDMKKSDWYLRKYKELCDRGRTAEYEYPSHL